MPPHRKADLTVSAYELYTYEVFSILDRVLRVARPRPLAVAFVVAWLVVGLAGGGWTGASVSRCPGQCTADPEPGAGGQAVEIRCVTQPGDVSGHNAARHRVHPRGVVPAVPPAPLVDRAFAADAAGRRARPRPPSSGRNTHLRIGVLLI
jgi:hypothetical protein